MNAPRSMAMLPVLLVCTAVLASCTGGDQAGAFALPAGPAVTVDAGYEPPMDRVASTGAHLPANGKPTLVFVDAIW